jgi:hypothetical protein
MQLEAYIQSLAFYSGLPLCTISVLYTHSSETSYERLIERYPDVHWVKETCFYKDLSKLVQESPDYILFGCDDVFFTDHFDVNVAMERLLKDSTLFGFSLRLGLNLHSLPDILTEGDVICWDWKSAAPGHWSYPWEVSASIYRRSDVAERLAATPEAVNPNRLEACVASAMRDTNVAATRLASYRRSKSLTLIVNRVQNEYPNEVEGSKDTEIGTLFKGHQEGLLLDWPRFYGVENAATHVGREYFSLCNRIMRPDVSWRRLSVQPTRVVSSHGALRLKILFWRYAVTMKETLRPYVPRSVMRALRRLLERI